MASDILRLLADKLEKQKIWWQNTRAFSESFRAGVENGLQHALDLVKQEAEKREAEAEETENVWP
jgi:predicted aminopeptidase